MQNAFPIASRSMHVDRRAPSEPIEHDIFQDAQPGIFFPLLEVIALARLTAGADNLEHHFRNAIRTQHRRSIPNQEDPDVSDPVGFLIDPYPALADDLFHNLGMGEPAGPQVISDRFGAVVVVWAVRGHDQELSLLSFVSPGLLELGLLEFFGRERPARVAGAEHQDGSMGRHHGGSWNSR
jgi:hypothetical protein